MQSLSTAFALAATGTPQLGVNSHIFWMIVFMLVLDEDARRDRERRRKREQSRKQTQVLAKPKPKPPAGPR